MLLQFKIYTAGERLVTQDVQGTPDCRECTLLSAQIRSIPGSSHLSSLLSPVSEAGKQDTLCSRFLPVRLPTLLPEERSSVSVLEEGVSIHYHFLPPKELKAKLKQAPAP